MTPLLVIEESVIRSLLNDTQMCNAFPFLRRAAEMVDVIRRSCRSCGGQTAVHRKQADIINGIKQSIAGMASARKLEFKRRLNAHKVRVIYRTQADRRVNLTF